MGDFGFGGFDFGDLEAALEGLLGDIIAALQYIWNVLVSVAQFLYNIAVLIAQAVVDFLKAAEALMVHILETLWNTIIKPIITELQKLEKWLNQTLKPVLNILKRINTWYQQYIVKWAKLIDQIISEVRLFLSIFKLLGFKWAQKLDNDLALVETYINEYVLAFAQALNALTSWVQLLSDPTQILRKAFWQTTAFSGMGEVYKAANIGAMKPLSTADVQQGQANLALLNPATPPVTTSADGSVTLSPTMQDIQAKLMAALPDYNPTATGYTGPVQT